MQYFSVSNINISKKQIVIITLNHYSRRNIKYATVIFREGLEKKIKMNFVDYLLNNDILVARNHIWKFGFSGAECMYNGYVNDGVYDAHDDVLMMYLMLLFSMMICVVVWVMGVWWWEWWCVKLLKEVVCWNNWFYAHYGFW